MHLALNIMVDHRNIRSKKLRSFELKNQKRKLDSTQIRGLGGFKKDLDKGFTKDWNKSYGVTNLPHSC